MKTKKALITETSDKYEINITIDSRLNSISVKNRNSDKLAKANKVVAHLNLDLNR